MQLRHESVAEGFCRRQFKQKSGIKARRDQRATQAVIAAGLDAAGAVAARACARAKPPFEVDRNKVETC